jgi:hypothetical protein
MTKSALMLNNHFSKIINVCNYSLNHIFENYHSNDHRKPLRVLIIMVQNLCNRLTFGTFTMNLVLLLEVSALKKCVVRLCTNGRLKSVHEKLIDPLARG